MSNAANPKQQAAIARLEREREARFVAALRAVLATPEGRLIFGERERGLLARAGVYRSIWARDASIHYNAGKQDFGHELMALIVRADEQSYLTMEAESRALAQLDAAKFDTVTAATARPSQEQE